MPLPRYLVLFDIDGTLMRADGAGRASLKVALEQVYGTSGRADTYSLGGSLDRYTVRLLMTEAGIDEAAIWQGFDEVASIMEVDLRERIAARQHNVRSLPGTRELVAALHMHEDVLLGLLTGNFHATALVKLEAAGFDPTLFQVGAFGHEAEDRAALPPLAIERAKALTGVDFRGSQIVIVGDTPLDVYCGKGVSARSIGVMTGWATREEMENAEPDYLFDDLSDTEAILRVIFETTE